MKQRPIMSPRLQRRARIIRAIQAGIMLLIISFAFWLAVLPSAHADEWTTGQNTAEAAYLALVVVDWHQTREGQTKPNMVETNPVLGAHPSNSKVNAWFIGSNVVQFLIADALPTDLRNCWLAAGIAFEVSVVKNNKSIAIKNADGTVALVTIAEYIAMEVAELERLMSMAQHDAL